MPNGTYGGVKGWRKSTLFDCRNYTKVFPGASTENTPKPPKPQIILKAPKTHSYLDKALLKW